MNAQWTLCICAMLVVMPTCRATLSAVYRVRGILLLTIMSITVLHGILPIAVPWLLAMFVAVLRCGYDLQHIQWACRLRCIAKAGLIVLFQIGFVRLTPFNRLWGVSFRLVDCLLLLLIAMLLSRTVRDAWLIWSLAYVSCVIGVWLGGGRQFIIMLDQFWAVELGLRCFYAISQMPTWWSRRRTRNIV